MYELVDPQFKSHDGSALRVWRDTAKNAFLSEREGRPIFDEVIFVEVISPGSRDSAPVFEVVRIFAAEMNRAEPKYGQKYKEYKEFIDIFEKNEISDKSSLAGTPLSQWSEMSRTMAATLKAQSVFTVDALAALPDTKLNIVGPDGRTWREKAKAYVENAKNSSYATAIAADLDRERAKTADLQEQITALAERLQELQKEPGNLLKPADFENQPATDTLTTAPII